MSTKKYLLGGAALLLAAATGMAGYGFGVYSSDDYDLLCPGGFKDYRSRIALKDEQGIQIPPNTLIRLRYCEYNAQARLEFLLDKSEFEAVELEPVDGRWHYSLAP